MKKLFLLAAVLLTSHISHLTSAFSQCTNVALNKPATASSTYQNFMLLLGFVIARALRPPLAARNEA
ncbi:MAG: hypothetical protein AABZ32_00950, partial [Bacteroidota bacterium]